MGKFQSVATSNLGLKRAECRPAPQKRRTRSMEFVLGACGRRKVLALKTVAAAARFTTVIDSPILQPGSPLKCRTMFRRDCLLVKTARNWIGTTETALFCVLWVVGLLTIGLLMKQNWTELARLENAKAAVACSQTVPASNSPAPADLHEAAPALCATNGPLRSRTEG